MLPALHIMAHTCLAGTPLVAELFTHFTHKFPVTEKHNTVNSLLKDALKKG